MRHPYCTLASAALLLVAGTPSAQARYGGSLLHSNSHSSTGDVYTPRPGSPERQALMDAIRRKVGKASGKYVIFVVEHLKVSRGWAWVVVRPQSPGGGTHYDPVAALLHKQGGQWTVSHILDGDEITTSPDALHSKYPYAPPGIF